jgi:hypothetical protein
LCYRTLTLRRGGLFAHFFRRLPNGIYLKNNILGWQSSKKIERLIKLYPPSWFLNLKFWDFLLIYIDKKMNFFFQMKKIKN